MKTDEKDPGQANKSIEEDHIKLALEASPRRINRLSTALGLDRYLEIGVEEGLTFLQAKCNQ